MSREPTLCFYEQSVNFGVRQSEDGGHHRQKKDEKKRALGRGVKVEEKKLLKVIGKEKFRSSCTHRQKCGFGGA